MKNMTAEELESLGLDVSTIFLHQKRIQSFLAEPTKNALAVRDSCRIDNGGIIGPEKLKELADKHSAEEFLRGVVAFIPAAGAASRYFQPLVPLIDALSQDNPEQLLQVIEDLRQSGAENWALPATLQQLLKAANPVDEARKNRGTLLKELGRPKALQPAVVSGESFLALKNLENQLIPGIDGQVFIIPPSQKDEFQEEFSKLKQKSSFKTMFLEQGPKLSTIRFKPDGSPYRDSNGQLSPVPAGHGTLVQLIPEVKELVPEATTVFIRNIDNVMGNDPRAIEASKTFLLAHQWLLHHVEQIRHYLRKKNLPSGHAHAQKILSVYGSSLVKQDELESFLAEVEAEQQLYWQVLINVFHCSTTFARQQIKDCASAEEALIKLFQRPVNSLGQVANSGKDVGGSPVFTEAFSIPLTLCLELPHASAEDQKKFFANPEKATHFNPVFVASEIAPAAVYDLENSPFWILARKTVGNDEVVYHETVLYELLGNSILANVVFPEIPRILFNPHKSLADSQGRRLEDWIS